MCLIANVRYKGCCDGFLYKIENGPTTCKKCIIYKNRDSKKQELLKCKLKKASLNEKYLTRKNKRLKYKIMTLREELTAAMKRCATKKDTFIEEAIADLPDVQKLAVQQCIAAAKKGKQGRRYTRDWIYECLLMRIKSPSLYESIRRKDILPLPSQLTLAKYIRSFDIGFGFKKNLFETLRSKVACMSMQQREEELYCSMK